MKKILDGNSATANIAYNLSDVAFIYPITPSSPMAEQCDTMQAQNQLNIFDNKLKVVEMQSEGGVAGALHGSALTGSLTTTFTSSQGLLLMIPNMYKLAGELLPTVFHVSARTIASHALNIFGDHSDVMAVRQTGFAMLCSNNAQESQDMALASHIATIKSSVPFLHFFDGFRTSHELINVETISNEQIKEIYPFNELQNYKNNCLKNTNPKQFGTAQNSDVFFQNKEASNLYYNKVADIVEQTFTDINKITNRKYNLFEFVGNKNAQTIFVSMGSSCDVIEEYINKSNTQNVALIKVRLFRPFSIKHFVSLISKNAKNIVVLDRTKESGSIGEPLYLDIVSSLMESNINVKVFGGRYGLGGKDFNLDMVHSIVCSLNSNALKNHFTIGINDDVTNLSVPIVKFNESDNSCYSCKFYGLGSDGTVSANKNSIKLIGDNSNLFVQGYFAYDSKKSGSLTVSHLRFSKNEIKSHYLIDNADYIAFHNKKYLTQYDFYNDIKPNGTILVNCDENFIDSIPNDIKYHLQEKNITIYTINAESLANELNLGNKINTIMQTAFFYITNIVNFEEIKQQLFKMVENSYKKYGKDVIDLNRKAINKTVEHIKKQTLKNVAKTETTLKQQNSFIGTILNYKGDTLPVSSMIANGGSQTGTSKLEKRNISNKLPVWLPEKCIQCGACSMVCPHAVIKPILIDENTKLEDGIKFANAIGTKNAKFILQVSPKDCTGCKNCVNACPVKGKALLFDDNIKIVAEIENNFNHTQNLPTIKNPFPTNTPKGLQFERDYFEFSGACAGCGETPYIKLATQLFGNRMVIANATGCSSIYGGSCPTCPYTVDKFNLGPTWANSLFEDNAEFGLGMKVSLDNQQLEFERQLQEKLPLFKDENLKQTLQSWIENKLDAKQTIEIFKQVKSQLDFTNESQENINFVKDNLNNIIKKSVWIIGGDGWAYDIGFGGLDQVLASGENVNILVLDTEVYSNTGGQSSKSTPLGASAKFNTLGKTTNKKNLAQIAMTYKNVYVAQVAIGADKIQTIKTFKEAEAYNGPSLIIAYSTCINHGIKVGESMQQMKNAVDSGYFHLFRYNPQNEKPFVLDSKEPCKDYIEHALTEKRYSSLSKESQQTLLEKAKQNSIDLYNYYKKLNDN